MLHIFNLLSLLVALYGYSTHGFINPIKARDGSDPFMTYYNGQYYLLTTTWSNVQVTSASTIEGLKSATPKIVWTDTNPQRNNQFWAPELHRINGRWYIYYTAGQKVSDFVPTQRTWVLQGGTGDPLAMPFTFMSQVTPPNYNTGMLDATIYNITGKTYYIYASTSGGAMWIAELLSPNKTGPGILLTSPIYSWEKQGWAINEGPVGLTSPKGSHHIIFSASGCNTQYYELGYLKLTPGADPLVAKSWVKNPQPIFTSANGLYGPGHNGFFKSPDGNEDWNVFHANRKVDGGCDGGRQTFVQKVDWNTDDTPNLGQPLAAGTQIDPPSGEKSSISKY
ncbi:glycoside hydrolase family 43 protein [Zopfia rhizophila CBS 207.26]|uniref:Glycoside hydrolase family 43 protein n=1 Tax=Zopfia rhizophila CBS 207.26 TaxID=1314779 RepID=A0A6A6DYA0_9PEZI|nr:glycoside hydrolase family 43 protein [Zopfia rhizophila CBS 207.26]